MVEIPERRKPKHPIRVRSLSEPNYDDSVHISDESVEDDTDADPDWRKTPFYGRTQRVSVIIFVQRNLDEIL